MKDGVWKCRGPFDLLGGRINSQSVKEYQLHIQITHWDLGNGKCLRFIDDAHPAGFGVLSVKVSPEYLVRGCCGCVYCMHGAVHCKHVHAVK